MALLAVFGTLTVAALTLNRHADTPVAPNLPPDLLVPTVDVFVPCLPVQNLLKINSPDWWWHYNQLDVSTTCRDIVLSMC